MRLRSVLALGLVPAALSCGHGDTFGPQDYGSDDPHFSVGFPTRLTYNRGKDVDASWLPDGSAFIYTFEQFRFDEGDWCLGLLPATGGRRVQTLCPPQSLSADSVNAWRWANVIGDRLLYVRQANVPNREAPATWEIVVARRGAPEQVTAVRDVPTSLPGTVTHGGLSMPRWLDSNTFVYRADLAGQPRPCRACAPDTVHSGRDLVIVTVTGGTMTSALIPGTSYASSVAVRGSDEVFFTQGGDSRVFRWLRTTGAITVAFDFGTGIARGVQIAGNRLVAVVGGNVAWGHSDLFYPDAFGDSLLIDNGGFLHVVDLTTGNDGIVDQFQLWRNPALSPDGRRVLVHSAQPAPDIYLYELDP